jgi:hypothetical protein
MDLLAWLRAMNDSLQGFGRLGAVFAGIVALASFTVAARTFTLNLGRARLENAANLLYGWNKELDYVNNRSIRFAGELIESTGTGSLRVEKTASDIVKDIYDGKSVALPSAHYDAVVAILSHDFPEHLPTAPGGIAPTFHIKAEHSVFIRFQWLTWLNKVEAILTAWDTGAAHPIRMGNVFGPLIDALEAELDMLGTIEELHPQLPILFKFHNELQTHGRITVYPELFFLPTWLVPKSWRAIVWRPTRQESQHRTARTVGPDGKSPSSADPASA